MEPLSKEVLEKGRELLFGTEKEKPEMTEETKALAVRPLSHFQTPHDMASLRLLSKALAASGYFKDVKGEAQAITKIIAGAEIGLGPVTSLTAIYIVEGKPSYSANLVGAQIKRSERYDYRIKVLDDENCVIQFLERDNMNQWKEIGISRFSIEDAKKAGLAGKFNWKNYPRNMLFSRALTNGARWYCPDVFTFPVYTPEELDPDLRLSESGEVIEGTFVEESSQPARISETLEESISDPLANASDQEFDDAIQKELEEIEDAQEGIAKEAPRKKNQWETEILDLIVKKLELVQSRPHAVNILNISNFAAVPFGKLDPAAAVAYVITWEIVKRDMPKAKPEDRAPIVEDTFLNNLSKAKTLIGETK